MKRRALGFERVLRAARTARAPRDAGAGRVPEALVARTLARWRAVRSPDEPDWLEVLGRLVPWGAGVTAAALVVAVALLWGGSTAEDSRTGWERQIAAWVFTP